MLHLYFWLKLKCPILTWFHPYSPLTFPYQQSSGTLYLNIHNCTRVASCHLFACLGMSPAAVVPYFLPNHMSLSLHLHMQWCLVFRVCSMFLVWSRTFFSQDSMHFLMKEKCAMACFSWVWRVSFIRSVWLIADTSSWIILKSQDEVTLLFCYSSSLYLL